MSFILFSLIPFKKKQKYAYAIATLSVSSYSPITFWLPKPIVTKLCMYFMLQPPTQAGSLLADFSTLKKEAIRSSETWIYTRSTPRNIPEDDILL
jgi:hypothetical protein